MHVVVWESEEENQLNQCPSGGGHASLDREGDELGNDRAGLREC